MKLRSTDPYEQGYIEGRLAGFEMHIPKLTHNCNSWIIEDTTTGKAVVELFKLKNVKIALSAGPTRYRAHLSCDWLSALNAAPKNTKAKGE